MHIPADWLKLFEIFRFARRLLGLMTKSMVSKSCFPRYKKLIIIIFSFSLIKVKRLLTFMKVRWSSWQLFVFLMFIGLCFLPSHWFFLTFVKSKYSLLLILMSSLCNLLASFIVISRNPSFKEQTKHTIFQVQTLSKDCSQKSQMAFFLMLQILQ